MSLLADLLSAWVAALVEMLLMVWELLGFKRGLLVGALLIAFLLAFGVGIVLYLNWRADAHVANDNSTRELINKQCQSLPAKVEECGKLLTVCT